MAPQSERQARAAKLHNRNIRWFGFDMNPIVFTATALFVFVFAGWSLLHAERAHALFVSVQASIVTSFDWLFILSSNFFIMVSLYLAFSKLGHVRIGGIRGKPEFSNAAWYSMLLSAGMGIGLMFWAVGEPLHHFMEAPPIFTEAEDVHSSMAATFFHWGLHPWGIYALLSLALAFFAYNKKLPLSLRSVFYPLVGERVYGPLGDLIDTFAVLATLFGLATSLGLGIQQINSGLDHLLGIGFNIGIQVLLIFLITLLAVVSVVSGIDKGIKFLSTLNIRLAALFMIAVLLLGPTVYVIRLFANSLGVYLNQFIQSAFYVGQNGSAWQGDWSVFYLAWWISWSPFVGMFIARISRGRTIREFILGVLIIPSLLSFLWLSVFGGTAIALDAEHGGSLFAVVQDNLPGALFEMVGLLPMPFLANTLAAAMFVLVIALVGSYFITSSDSGSLVVDKITSGGKLNSPKRQRVFWALIEGLIAAVLLVVGGEQALSALQAAVISAGLPLCVILIIMTWSLTKGINEEYEMQSRMSETERISALIESTICEDEERMSSD